MTAGNISQSGLPEFRWEERQQALARADVDHEGCPEITRGETVEEREPPADLGDVGGPARRAAEVGDGKDHENDEGQGERGYRGPADGRSGERERCREESPQDQPGPERVIEIGESRSSDHGTREYLVNQGSGEQESGVAHAERTAKQLAAPVFPQPADKQAAGADTETGGEEDAARGAGHNPGLDQAEDADRERERR